jgi:magnesium transporter
VKIVLYTSEGVTEDPSLPLDRLLARPDGVLWVDITGPAADDVRVMREVFGFHPLAIEDTQKQAQRPKLEEYPGYFFMTLHALRPPAPQRAPVALQEIDLFFGPRYVVTVHPHAVPAIDEARQRLAKAAPALRPHTDFVLYTIVDTAVDTYFPVIDRIDQSLDRAADQLFRHPRPQDLDHLLALKRSLLQIRRVATPLRDIFNILMRRDVALVRPETLVYFRDVYDHLLRITDLIDTHRDLLTGAVEVYMSVVSNRLNEVMKILTVITALFAPLAVITGIYGMNFERAAPPFAWPYGFAAVLAAMAVVVALMLALFRRRGWL